MKQPISFITRMARVHIDWMTWFRGKLVGTDQAGNRYYVERKKGRSLRERRWVIYNGEPEATKVPPEWYGWLHHTSLAPLPENSPFHKPWQLPHQSNRSGSLDAHYVPGHILVGGSRPKATGDYEAWKPE